MIRLFVILMLALLAITILRMVAGVLAKGLGGALGGGDAKPQSKRRSQGPFGGELKKDPVCGTYVAAQSAVKLSVRGEELHFCSTTCRDRYQGR